ncbi:hypothetical protein C791_5598 [Amycolatopsis azurea DSM 43854]|uniref:Uncharacterized protein n=1 Tax=Amycolatopsis azurea DSM 43854 TaxID=1238180 RepID=M2PJE3_9PSEU|nr:hypothetical protein C791_5598 [Amycolatopsis azurea DSM 43854]
MLGGARHRYSPGWFVLTDWLRHYDFCSQLSIGFFCCSQ